MHACGSPVAPLPFHRWTLSPWIPTGLLVCPMLAPPPSHADKVADNINLEYEASLKNAYVVDRDGLHKLWQFMEEKAGEVTAQVRCSDGVRRSWKTWDGLSQFNNSGNAHINKLTMTAGDRWHAPWLSVDWIGIAGTEVEINFDEDRLAAIRDELHDIIGGMRHGLLTTTRRRLIPVGVGWAALAAVTLPVLLYAYARSRSEDTPNEVSLTLVIPLLVLWMVAAGAPSVYYLLLDPLLPRVHFAIGQGERRYKNWRNLWAGMGTTTLVILVGAITTLVAIAL